MGEKETRKVASRNLIKRCDRCGKKIMKGEVFYDVATFYNDQYDDWFMKAVSRNCAKCKHKHDSRLKRLKTCKHKITAVRYRYILGEAVMEPDYEYCTLCGKIIE